MQSSESLFLYPKDIGLIDFMKRIQLDRVYRSFEPGLITQGNRVIGRNLKGPSTFLGGFLLEIIQSPYV